MANQVKSIKKTITFNDVEVAYDPSILKSFIYSKKLAKANKENDQYAYFEYLDNVLCGKSEEVARKLGDDMDVMSDLLERITLVVGGEAKN